MSHTIDPTANAKLAQSLSYKTDMPRKWLLGT